MVNTRDYTYDFESSVCLGREPGYQIIHKFGGGIIGIIDRTIWDGMDEADYPFKFTNTPMTIVSNNALDVGQRIKVQFIKLVGSDWIYQKGVAITNGLTPVIVKEADLNYVSNGVDAAIMFPYRIINTGTGQSTGKMNGTLRIQNGGVTYGMIKNGYNQSLMAILPIATGYTGVIHSVGRSVVGSAKATTFTYSATPFGECRQAQRVAGLTSGSEYEIFDLPYYMPEKTILEVRGFIDVGTADVNAWFDVMLTKNENL